MEKKILAASDLMGEGLPSVPGLTDAMQHLRELTDKDGREHGLILSPKGRIVVADLVGDSTHIKIDDDNVYAALRGNYMLHSHPVESPLSLRDILSSCAAGCEGVVATMPNGGYSYTDTPLMCDPLVYKLFERSTLSPMMNKTYKVLEKVELLYGGTIQAEVALRLLAKQGWLKGWSGKYPEWLVAHLAKYSDLMDLSAYKAYDEDVLAALR